MTRRFRTFVVVLGLALLSTVALAQLRTRRVGVRWENGVPQVSVGLRDLVSSRVRRELQSGLRKRIVVTAQAYRVGNSRALATRTFSCAVTYDLWQESYVVRIGSRSEVFQELRQVVDRCLSIRGLPVGQADQYENVHGRDIFFAVRAEFDPIDPIRCREMLRSSGGGGDPIGPIVVNIVRRDICQADRVVEFRSPVVTCP
ncbi:MAG: hypothetical protein AB8H86_03885 [Polyangiales bacterium]